MDSITFPSLADPKTMYAWKQGFCIQGGHPGIKSNASCYQTYGDGQTQHAPDGPVSVDSALDYLASLAAYLAENHDTETLECIANDWPHPESHIGRPEVKFCLNLKYREGKTRYYNKSECKVSSADSKRHDRRWVEIVEYMDGTIKAALSLCRPSYYHPLDTYALCEFIERVAHEENDSTHSALAIADLAGFIGRDGNNQYDLANAFHVVGHFVRAHRSLDAAVRSWGCLQNNYVKVLERE